MLSSSTTRPSLRSSCALVDDDDMVVEHPVREAIAIAVLTVPITTTFFIFCILVFLFLFFRLMKISILGLCDGNSQRLSVPGDDLVAFFDFLESFDLVANGDLHCVPFGTFQFHFPL